MSARSRMQTAKSRAVRCSVTFCMAPGPVRIEKHEQIGRAIASIFAIVTFRLTRLRRDRLAHLANQLSRTLVEANHRMLWIGFFGVEIENVLHTGDLSTVHM